MGELGMFEWKGNENKYNGPPLQPATRYAVRPSSTAAEDTARVKRAGYSCMLRR